MFKANAMITAPSQHLFTARKLSLDIILNGTHSHLESTRLTRLTRTLTYRCLRICSSTSLLQTALNDLTCDQAFIFWKGEGHNRRLLTILKIFCQAMATPGVLLLTTWMMLWPETETNLKILSLRYPKEMFSSFCLIWDFKVNSWQSNLNLVSTNSVVALT